MADQTSDATSNGANDNTLVPKSIVSHVFIGTNDMARAVTFYDAVMGALGYGRVMEHGDVAVAYGTAFPEFWVQTPIDGQKAQVANGVHFGFFATSRQQVDEFFRAAVAAGAKEDGAPGPREEYSAAYYGCFVRDPDGHKIEASFWDEVKAAELFG